MLNKVVSTLQRTARDAGLITLRFNYRGVGQSAGSHDMGRGSRRRPGGGPWLGNAPGLPLTLFGFSFGGFVAASLGGAWKRGRGVAQLFMVAPAVMRLDDRTATDCPLTVIQPETDEVVDAALVYDWSERSHAP
jgi:alpha/beta superfamily hydrolase